MNRPQKLDSYTIKKVHEQHGVVSLIMAISMTMLLGSAALAIDLGHAWVVKQELQNVADAKDSPSMGCGQEAPDGHQGLRTLLLCFRRTPASWPW